jgi:hypothetical protein
MRARWLCTMRLQSPPPLSESGDLPSFTVFILTAILPKAPAISAEH